MTHPEFSIHDVRYRRSSEHECQIIVYGRTVGTLTRVPDFSAGAGEEPSSYVIGLHDDRRGRRQVHHRAQIRLATADMLWDRGLVPPAPLPGNPMLHAQHAAGASR